MTPLIVIDERCKEWLKRALRKTFHVLITLFIGAALGAFVHLKWTQKPDPPDAWGDTEEKVLEKMQDFQLRLAKFEAASPDSVEAMSKQMEVQRGIMDILIKWREAHQAKNAPYLPVVGTALAPLLTGLFGFFVARVGSRNRTVGQ